MITDNEEYGLLCELTARFPRQHFSLSAQRYKMYVRAEHKNFKRIILKFILQPVHN